MERRIGPPKAPVGSGSAASPGALEAAAEQPAEGPEAAAEAGVVPVAPSAEP
jgi:hypothetical protein